MDQDTKRLLSVFALICLMAIASFFVIAFLTARGAYAHAWYARTNCCSGNDCAPVPLDADWVRMEEHGYRIVLTAEQAKLINPSATKPVDAFIPWGNSRIKAPPILKPGESYGPTTYHLCIPGSWSGVYCLFVVPGV